MRILLPVLAVAISGCTTLVSTSQADFPNGYATLYTTSNVSTTGDTCNAGTVTYYKPHVLSGEYWIGDGYPYYAAPGSYRVALWCQSDVDSKTGQCLDRIYVDTGGPELKVKVEADRSYVIYCGPDGPKIEDRESFDRRH
jgi:hypothetical protein